jgi:threonine/homoserine/homoserine lactone efflux protein
MCGVLRGSPDRGANVSAGRCCIARTYLVPWRITNSGEGGDGSSGTLPAVLAFSSEHTGPCDLSGPAFLAAVLVMQVTPGPDMALVSGRGVGQGQRIAFCTVLGFMAAGLVQVPLLVLGVASLLHASPLASDLMRWFGATYLAWLGIKLVWSSRHGSSLGRLGLGGRLSALSAVPEGLINNLTNPKPLLFMFALLPQFVSPDRGSVAVQLLALGGARPNAEGDRTCRPGLGGSGLRRGRGLARPQVRLAGLAGALHRPRHGRARPLQ